jgi:hypothetical protein
METLCTFDLVTDLIVLNHLLDSSDVGWLCTMILSILLPFLVSYVQFISFQQSKIKETFKEKKNKDNWFTILKAVFYVTPLLVL